MSPRPETFLLTCAECSSRFAHVAGRRGTAPKYCAECRRAVKARQTRASCQRHADARRERQRAYEQKRRDRKRDEIREYFRRRYATDPDHREHKRALARQWAAAHGGTVHDPNRRKAIAATYYAKNKAEHNRRCAERARSQPFRQSVCGVCGIDDPRVLTVHHRIPLAKGGTSDRGNLETLCRNCHAIADCDAVTSLAS